MRLRDDELRAITSSAERRDGDRRIFMEPAIANLIESLDIEVVTWKQARRCSTDRRCYRSNRLATRLVGPLEIPLVRSLEATHYERPSLQNLRVFLAALSLVGCVSLVAVASSPDKVDFNFHIRPLLSDRCYACHGPDAEDREADLRLDSEATAYAALEGATASHVIKPGEPEQSEVYLRIAAEDPDERMPPPESNLSLTADEIELIRKWIEQGAKWKQHWSFVPVEQVQVPPAPNSSRVHNEIDHFVLARLEAENVTAAPEASREKLFGG